MYYMYVHTHTHTHTHIYNPTTRLLGAFGPALDLAPRPLIWVGARGAAATATQVVGAAGYLRRWGLVG